MDTYWSTPIWQYDLTNLKAIEELINISYECKNKEKGNGLILSNAGFSWHSPHNFAGPTSNLSITNEVMSCFKRSATDYGYVLKSASLSYWTIVTSKYGYNRRHNHPGSLLSGVLYLKVPEKSGSIRFTDPRLGKILEPSIGRDDIKNCGAITIDPKVGLFVIFPSFLEHEVEMTLADEDRIIASFNLNPLS